MRTGTPASAAGNWHSSAARLRVCTIAGRKFAEQLQQPGIELDAMPGRLVQRNELDIVALDAPANAGSTSVSATTACR